MMSVEALIAANLELHKKVKNLEDKVNGAKELLKEAEPYIPSTMLTQAINDFICSN